MVWCGLVWYGMVWYVRVWCIMDQYGYVNVHIFDFSHSPPQAVLEKIGTMRQIWRGHFEPFWHLCEDSDDNRKTRMAWQWINQIYERGDPLLPFHVKDTIRVA